MLQLYYTHAVVPIPVKEFIYDPCFLFPHESRRGVEKLANGKPIGVVVVEFSERGRDRAKASHERVLAALQNKSFGLRKFMSFGAVHLQNLASISLDMSTEATII